MSRDLIAVYSFGKSGSETIAGRITPDPAVAVKLEITGSELIRGNVLHLHSHAVFTRLLASAGDYDRLSVIYPIRGDLVAQAISHYFQFLKRLQARPNTELVNQLIAIGIEGEGRIADTPLDAVLPGFMVFFGYWLKWNPGAHLLNCLRLVGLGDPASLTGLIVDGRSPPVRFGNNVQVHFILTECIDRYPEYLTAAAFGTYDPAGKAHNVSSESSFAPLYHHLKGQLVLTPAHRKTVTAMYRGEPLRHFIAEDMCCYL